MKLFYAPGACSLAPHIVINEAKLGVKLDDLASVPPGHRVRVSGPDVMVEAGEDLSRLPANAAFDEKVDILKTCRRAAGDRFVVAGIAGLSTSECVSLARAAWSSEHSD